MYEELTEGELGYIAGIVDGEGTLSIKRENRNGKHGRGRVRKYRLKPYLYVSSTNYEMLCWLKDKIGCGWITDYKKQKTLHPERKLTYRYQFRSITRMKELLPKIMPYLIIKRVQANKIVEFVNLGSSDWENKERCKAELKDLNRRGDKNRITTWIE